MIDARRAAALWSEGALLVDIRPALQRRHFGEIPTALTIERNVLEWRLEPDGAHRHPRVAAHSGPIIVFCQEGHASSLAVMSLVDVGVSDVHDLAGGFRAWAEAHLPTDQVPSTLLNILTSDLLSRKYRISLIGMRTEVLTPRRPRRAMRCRRRCQR